MNEYMKRFQVRVFDAKDIRGEFVDEYNTLEEAQTKVKELEDHRTEILNSDEPSWVKNHYEDLKWKIFDMKEDR